MSTSAQTFLQQASEFQLGRLPTESRHPLTGKLSQLAKNNLPVALRLMHEVELTALKSLLQRPVDLRQLEEEAHATINAGGRIFLCGCGATGRLSLVIETLWREIVATHKRPDLKEKVFSFMAGGDYALIRSIEKFEDHFEFGARQLRDAGFREGDLLIASTEGGETPFVIGAAEEATAISSRRPFFNFCNPADLLCKTTERSKRVIENPKIRSLSFETGPMALSGSTRLQASSALMLAAGAALFSYVDGKRAVDRVSAYLETLRTVDFTALAPLIEKEAAHYAAGGLCVHRTRDYGITVVTDTTERTPTFSLLPFESNLHPADRPSWTYLCMANASTTEEAWRLILHREPRPLNWEGFTERFGMESLHSFDFSRKAEARRAPVLVFSIERTDRNIEFSIDGATARLKKPDGLLEEHLLLKAALNTASTLLMGRLDRFSSNLMLYVRATNNKLVDRAIRYVQALLEDEGLTTSYESICETLYELMPTLAPDEPIVLMTFEVLRETLGKKVQESK
jgi:N-acetylmuramic acid 6-phosphate etherase